VSSIPPVQSIRRAFAVLEALGERGDLGVTEVSKATDFTPSTAHRLLITLVDCGYVSQDPRTSKYRLAGRLVDLASRVPDRWAELRQIARPHLEALKAATGESANLVVLVDRDVVYIDQVEGTRSLRMFTEPGHRTLAHTTGAGKAILAYRDADSLSDMYPEKLATMTPRTIGTLAELEIDLGRARERGYAVDDEEHEVGVSCVAAAVDDESGAAIAALSISGPTPRMINANTPELGRLLRRHAADVSLALRSRERAARAS
jgi:DNA-binding IclR family transcriptional regulator